MGLERSDESESRFSAYIERLTTVIGHVDRAKPLRDYCVGLMLPCERKSVEPMAAATAPARVSKPDGVCSNLTGHQTTSCRNPAKRFLKYRLSL